MSWSVICRPKHKNDVHGITVEIVHDENELFNLEASRVAFWRRPEVAARSQEKFEDVLRSEVEKAEKAIPILNRLDEEYARARREAQARAADELRKIFPKPAHEWE